MCIKLPALDADTKAMDDDELLLHDSDVIL